MKFRGCLIIVILIFEPLGISAELKLQPPWLQVIQYVNENYNVKCEGEGDKIWLNPTGRDVNTGSIPGVSAVKKPLENVLQLKFNKIRKEHKGFYNCTTNIRGKKYSKAFELIVIKPATFENTTTEIVVNEGTEAVLDCLPDGEPTPEISWYFNDELIAAMLPMYPSSKYSMQGVSLKIADTTWKESGTYTCRAFQKILQNRDAELVFRLKVRHKPVALEKNITVYGFRSESRNLTCQVIAHPTAYFIWYRDNKPIDPKIDNLKIYNEDNISILEIFYANSGVLGEYICEAANPFGMQTINIELQSIDKPETPKLLIHDVYHTSVIISVQPYPSYEFVCKMFYTEYTYCSYEEKWKKAKLITCRNKKISNTNKTHCTIDNLKPQTKYSVKAELMNPGGNSNSSDELLFKTRKEPILLSSATRIIKSYFLYFIVTFIRCTILF
ncbi:hemicentin-1-like [Planococcus citri]|uniref:hemicentin-1-like n=1 Tax=Planococcus citri TaxID=170843 RepID=UPI0031F922E4